MTLRCLIHGREFKYDRKSGFELCPDCEAEPRIVQQSKQGWRSQMPGAKPTPGPWKVDDRNEVRDANGDLLVAEIMGETREIYEANARLIASAPTLLEALKAILNLADKETTWRNDVKWMREGTRYGIYLSADMLEQINAAILAAEKD